MLPNWFVHRRSFGSEPVKVPVPVIVFVKEDSPTESVRLLLFAREF